ncbi:RNA polymerase sigma-70 factor [Fulvivirgaceae bacterium BMA10]|uniref:RNA polymerase sigma-70 factor n=1 Tax=Splendidivirga corallicola TaxID=3051826 RepID=A0ABT8KPQ7_9BACT|nr:RNA polymerase sigma-70 factor [Fulvivirgaceae bacterium BMA10]
MKEKDLIKRIRKGNEKAFRSLYELYFNKVANYAFKLLRSEEDAREVAQDVFIKLWNMKEELEAEKPISGLIFKITKFTSIDLIRKQQANIRTIHLWETPLLGDCMPDSDLNGRELYAEYLKILSRLPEKRKRIFQMSRDENLSHKEIAAKLNISVKTVEAQIRLALQQIRKYLKDYSNTMMLALTTIFFS